VVLAYILSKEWKLGKRLRGRSRCENRRSVINLARAIKMPLDPERKLPTPTPSVYLFEEFCTPQEERYLLTKVEELGGVEVDGPEGDDPTATRRYKDKGTAAGWRVVKGRRQAGLRM
jgi:hypothetical protein